MRTLVIMGMILLTSASADATGLSPVAPAMALFDEYCKRSHRFDPSVSELYADTARIRSIHTDAQGVSSETRLTAKRYKEVIKAAMAIAKRRGDLSDFPEVRYEATKEGVWIRAQRYSRIRDRLCDFAQFVGKDKNGKWKIFEEISYSKE